MDDEFARFVNDRSAALYRYGYVLTGNRHDADDLVQEALIRLRGSWGRLLDQSDPEGYVRTTMARLHISTWRRRRRENLTSAPPDRGRVDTAIAVGLPSMLTDRARPNAAPAAPSAQPQPSVTASPPGPDLGPLKFPTTTAGLAPVQKVWPRAVEMWRAPPRAAGHTRWSPSSTPPTCWSPTSGAFRIPRRCTSGM